MNKLPAWIWILLCYIVAFLGAWLTVSLLTLDNVILETFFADVVATTLVFIFSLIFRNASFYDPYWSVAPPVIAFYWKYQFSRPEWTLTEMLTIAVVIFWALRLTSNWYRSGAGMKHEDWRYENLQQQTGVFYPVVSYLGIHTFPTVLVFLGCLPLAAFFMAGGSLEKTSFLFPLLFAAGVLLGFMAPVIQYFADEQMRQHRNTPGHHHIDTGLWRYSRHPNYFGEIMFWIALAIIGYSTGYTDWWIGLGALAMILLFLVVSIPMMEKRMAGKHSGYEGYRKKVSMLVPWFRKEN